jgi:spore coat protein U-like protein
MSERRTRYRSGCRFRIGVLAVALLLPGLRARAASSCSLVGVTGLNFGSYDVFDARPTTQVGSVTFKCQSGGIPIVPVTIELSQGNSGTYAFRQLRKGNESLRYNLHLDATNTLVWGNGTGGSLSFGPLLPPDNVETTVTIYGRILPGQNLTAGSYTDTITITINF